MFWVFPFSSWVSVYCEKANNYLKTIESSFFLDLFINCSVYLLISLNFLALRAEDKTLRMVVSSWLKKDSVTTISSGYDLIDSVKLWSLTPALINFLLYLSIYLLWSISIIFSFLSFAALFYLIYFASFSSLFISQIILTWLFKQVIVS